MLSRCSKTPVIDDNWSTIFICNVMRLSKAGLIVEVDLVQLLI